MDYYTLTKIILFNKDIGIQPNACIKPHTLGPASLPSQHWGWARSCNRSFWLGGTHTPRRIFSRGVWWHDGVFGTRSGGRCLCFVGCEGGVCWGGGGQRVTRHRRGHAPAGAFAKAGAEAAGWVGWLWRAVAVPCSVSRTCFEWIKDLNLHSWKWKHNLHVLSDENTMVWMNKGFESVEQKVTCMSMSSVMTAHCSEYVIESIELKVKCKDICMSSVMRAHCLKENVIWIYWADSEM